MKAIFDFTCERKLLSAYECEKMSANKRLRFYEDLNHLEENRMSQRAYYIPENENGYTLLNGEWKFNFYDADYKEECEIKAWDKIPVPSCWQLFGYEEPNYSNVAYPYPVDAPLVPDENPMGIYARSFVINDMSKCYYMVFEGASSNIELYINDKYVGYSQGSHLQAEFDISRFSFANIHILWVMARVMLLITGRLFINIQSL